MPNIEHEFPLDLVRRSPETAVQLLRLVTNEPLPDYERVRCEASEATVTAAPAELVSDSVVVLERDADGRRCVRWRCRSLSCHWCAMQGWRARHRS